MTVEGSSRGSEPGKRRKPWSRPGGQARRHRAKVKQLLAELPRPYGQPDWKPSPHQLRVIQQLADLDLAIEDVREVLSGGVSRVTPTGAMSPAMWSLTSLLGQRKAMYEALTPRQRAKGKPW